MKTEWYDSMIKTLQLNGKGERTQEALGTSTPKPWGAAKQA
jgi:hypothetical protein